MFKFAHQGAVAFLFFFATIVSAIASQWTVVNVKQPAYFSHAGDQWNPVQRGMKLPNGTWVNTKRGARVLLKRGGDTILINANSLTGITGTRGKNGRIKMQHRKGDVELSIKPGRRGRVRVVTPHVAAVVKGTVFSVSTNKRGSTVAVSRGLVSVSDNRSGDSANVSAGKSVTAKARRAGLRGSAVPKNKRALSALQRNLERASGENTGNQGNHGNNGNQGNHGNNGNQGNNGNNGNQGNNENNGNQGNNENNGNQGNNGNNGNQGNQGNQNDDDDDDDDDQGENEQ